MKLYLALFIGLLFLTPAMMPAAAPNPAGLWEGILQTPNGDLTFVFNLHRDSEIWVAEMDIPQQGISELPLKTVKVDGAAVSIALPGQGDPHYDGKLSDDGKTINGTFSQAGTSFPLNLKWKSEPRAASKPQANSGDVQVLEGIWEGTLDANGTTLHTHFNFTKNADGTISGTFAVVEQGATDLAINGISRMGDTVKLDLKIVGGTYTGTLSKDNSSITGKLSQGGMDVTLNLLRKKSDKP
jgi:hypothetical protein